MIQKIRGGYWHPTDDDEREGSRHPGYGPKARLSIQGSTSIIGTPTVMTQYHVQGACIRAAAVPANWTVYLEIDEIKNLHRNYVFELSCSNFDILPWRFPLIVDEWMNAFVRVNGALWSQLPKSLTHINKYTSVWRMLTHCRKARRTSTVRGQICYVSSREQDTEKDVEANWRDYCRSTNRNTRKEKYIRGREMFHFSYAFST